MEGTWDQYMNIQRLKKLEMGYVQLVENRAKAL
jgi:hypothetical protein